MCCKDSSHTSQIIIMECYSESYSEFQNIHFCLLLLCLIVYLTISMTKTRILISIHSRGTLIHRTYLMFDIKLKLILLPFLDTVVSLWSSTVQNHFMFLALFLCFFVSAPVARLPYTTFIMHKVITIALSLDYHSMHTANTIWCHSKGKGKVVPVL
jgi:hypothetical protein